MGWTAGSIASATTPSGVMDGFASSLRDRVDPEEVMTGWVGVVSSTMQPDAIGMWMRDDDGADAGDPSP